jgi:hypothetical protein
MLFIVNCFQQKEGEYGADAVRDALSLVKRNAIQGILFLANRNAAYIMHTVLDK